MADNSVFITGAANGAFADALNGLPPWATENTALNIEKQLRMQTKSLSDLVKKVGKGGAGGDPKIHDELNKLLIEEAKQRKKDLEEAKKKEKKDKEKADKELIWGKKIETANAAWLIVLEGLSIFGNRVKETLIQNIKSYDELQAAGVNLVSGLDSASTGFEALQQITALSNVRYTELAATMSKFSSAVNVFTAGKFAKTVGKASAELTQFGYSSKESAELLGVYLDSQKGYSDIRNKTEAETTAEVVKFGERITNVSMATGMMRGKILENLDAISKSTEAALLTGQTSVEQSGKVQEFISSFADQKLGNQILKMMTDAVKPLNATFMAMQKTGGGAFAQAEQTLINNMKRNGASAEEMQEGLADFVNANRTTIMRQMQQNNLLEQAGKAEGAIANEHLNGLLQQANSYKKLNADEKEKLKRTSTASKNLANAQERLASEWQRAFANFAPVLSGIASILNVFSTIIEHVTDFLGPTVTSLIGMLSVVTGSFASIVAGFRIFQGIIQFVAPTIFKPLVEAAKFVISPFIKLGSVLMRSIGSVGEFFGKIFTSIGGFTLRFLGIIGALVTAFEVGYKIGTYIYDMVKDFQWFNTMMDTIFKGLDHILQYIPGSIGSDARERISDSEKVEAQSKAKSTEISIPKSPAPSTIDSPSAVPAKPSEWDNSSPASAGMPTTPTAPGIDKSPVSTDINSTLAAHTNVLQQILLATENNVSVNKDILKYARNST